MTSPLALLSPDIKSYVFDHLPLQSCLRFSECSKQCLQEVLPHLKQRRFRQFCQRHAYRLLDPCRLFPTSDVYSKDLSSRTALSEIILQPITGDQNQCHVLMTVRERLHALEQALPASHSSSQQVRELVLDLQEDPQLLSEQGFMTNNFAMSLQELQSVCTAHRLHEQLLSASTVSCRPPIAGGQANLTTTSFTTSLDQYIGDVLIVYFLMGHSVAKMVEGVTTHQRWAQDLLWPRDEDIVEGPIHWYRRWIFMHSTLLRTFPMTREQLSHYKLPHCGILGKLHPQAIEYVHPHYCFLGTGTSVVAETTVVVHDLSRHQLEAFRGDSLGPPIFVHSTRVNAFGTLGPFRGRDNVRSTVMEPNLLLEHLEHPSFAISPTWLLLVEGHHVIVNNDRFAAWFASAGEAADANENLSVWFRYLSQTCYRSRPMSVQAPLVTIEMLVVQT